MYEKRARGGECGLCFGKTRSLNWEVRFSARITKLSEAASRFLSSAQAVPEWSDFLAEYNPLRYHFNSDPAILYPQTRA